MSEVLQANIFFAIASIAFVIATLFVCVILYHIIKLIQSIRRIIDRIDESSEVIADDVAQLRTYVQEGTFVSQIMSLIFGQKGRTSRSKKK